MLELKDYEHKYYCNTSNYHSNRETCFYDTWKEYLEEWGDADDDFNLMIRWDIREYDEDDGEGFCMEVFYILQRKGNFVPVIIKNITQEDMESISKFLKQKFEHLSGLWNPFNYE